MNIFKPDKFSLPVDIFLKLFNNLPGESILREEILDYIRTLKSKVDPKAHVTEGFRLTIENELVFDDFLYTEAVYRSKIERYTNAAKESIKKLRDDFDMIKGMGDEHALLCNQLSQDSIDQKIVEGKPISEEEIKILSKLTNLLLN